MMWEILKPLYDVFIVVAGIIIAGYIKELPIFSKERYLQKQDHINKKQLFK